MCSDTLHLLVGHRTASQWACCWITVAHTWAIILTGRLLACRHSKSPTWSVQLTYYHGNIFGPYVYDIPSRTNPFINLTPTIMANAPQQPSLPSSAPKCNAPATKTQPTALKRWKIAPALPPTPSSDENSSSHPTVFGVGPCGHAAPSSCEPLTGDHAGGAQSVKPSNP